MFKTIKCFAISAALLASAAVAHASPVLFNVNLSSITPGSGYGIDANEANGTLLDVRFNPSTAPHAFTLTNSGDYAVFNVGSMTFMEPDSHGGINNAEASGNLNVTATFSFTNPFGGTQTLQALGFAQVGAVSDSFVDYQLTWLATTVSFNGGSFSLALLPVAFDNNNETQQLMAMITLNPASFSNEVPEPASLALIGLALAGVSLVRRKRA